MDTYLFHALSMERFCQAAEYAKGTVFAAAQSALSDEVLSEMLKHNMGSYKLRSKTISILREGGEFCYIEAL